MDKMWARLLCKRFWRLGYGLFLALALLAAQPFCAPAAGATDRGRTPPAAAAAVRFEGVGRFLALALRGEAVTVRGRVTPPTRGELVALHLYQQGRIVVRKEARLGKDGRFRFTVAVPASGWVRAVVFRPPGSPGLPFGAATKPLPVVEANLAPGAVGTAVSLLQQGLARLHYAIVRSGRFEAQTGAAVIAYRKLTGLVPGETVEQSLWQRLRGGAGGYRSRFPWDGRHIEADLGAQVLVEVAPRGRVRAIYPISSGKPSTPTVVGHFLVYRQEPGVNSEGMYDSSYFYSGYAIHGYPEVPTYPASHGCLRLPNFDAPAVFHWVRIGTPVDVFN